MESFFLFARRESRGGGCLGGLCVVVDDLRDLRRAGVLRRGQGGE